MNLADSRAQANAAGKLLLARGSVRDALSTYGLELEDVADWGVIAEAGLLGRIGDPEGFRARLAGALGAAVMLGIELARSGEVPE